MFYGFCKYRALHDVFFLFELLAQFSFFFHHFQIKYDFNTSHISKHNLESFLAQLNLILASCHVSEIFKWVDATVGCFQLVMVAVILVRGKHLLNDDFNAIAFCDTVHNFCCIVCQMSFIYLENLNNDAKHHYRVKLDVIGLAKCPCEDLADVWIDNRKSWSCVEYADVYYYLVESHGVLC